MSDEQYTWTPSGADQDVNRLQNHTILTISGRDYEIEGVHHAGLLHDLAYRPNKYFHPIDRIQYANEELTIRYNGTLEPLTESTRLSLEQIQELLFGVIDARQQLAHQQTFYIARHPRAFGLDERGRVKISLLNVDVPDQQEQSDEARSVEALLDLIAGHSPEAQKRIQNYRHKVYTLRQLKQVLERGSNHQWLLGVLVILAVLGVSLGLLANFGPPRLRNSLQTSWKHAKLLSSRALRSGSDEWFAQLRDERQRKNRKYLPVDVNLVIQPIVHSPKERQQLYLTLHKLLTKEFPLLKYQLYVPYLNFSKKAARLQQSLCGNAFPGHPCKSESWILVLPGFKGSVRPLVDAVKESLQQKTRGKTLAIRYRSITGLLTLSLKHVKTKAKKRTIPSTGKSSSTNIRQKPVTR